MARRLAVSEATIRRALRKAGLRRQPLPEPELPFDPANATLAATTPVTGAGVAKVALAASKGNSIEGRGCRRKPALRSARRMVASLTARRLAIS